MMVRIVNTIRLFKRRPYGNKRVRFTIVYPKKTNEKRNNKRCEFLITAYIMNKSKSKTTNK